MVEVLDLKKIEINRKLRHRVKNNTVSLGVGFAGCLHVSQEWSMDIFLDNSGFGFTVGAYPSHHCETVNLGICASHMILYSPVLPEEKRN